MKVTIKIFANLKDYLPEEFQLIIDEDSSIEQLRNLLINKQPQIKNILDNSRFAINEEFVDDNTIIKKNNTIYIIPPVSGG
ncbi:MAG: MoaD/ThiS family protein [Melioribacter sp.]|uniref:MoaD/ThiS family protein n=1 Tax=Rosettibacter primus TaxID=3111523 RepID=UPI00247D37F9|nr:MoaD/ThiS family protein [Melioribacter sp.]